MFFSVNHKRLAFLSSLICLPAAFLLLFSDLPLISLLLAFLILALFWLSVFDFKLGFLAIIFLRPFLDLSVNNIIFTFGILQVNVLSLLGMVMIILALLFVVFIGSDWRFLKKMPSFYAWMLFLFLGLLSIFNSFYPAESLKEILRFISIFSAFIFGALLLPKAKDMTVLIKVIIFFIKLFTL
jgi:hypothetical protein